jgi:hypothetical protein
MVEQSDEYALIKRSIDGDHEAFAQLMERYAGSVFNLAYRMLGNVRRRKTPVRRSFCGRTPIWRVSTRNAGFRPGFCRSGRTTASTVCGGDDLPG